MVPTQQFLHVMVRVMDLQASLHFYCELLGLRETRRKDYEEGRFSLIFLGMPQANGQIFEFLELTHNWDNTADYGSARNFGHIALGTANIYELCESLKRAGVTINRPPRDGRMAFVRSPDNISIEILQIGNALAPQEPWSSMENTGSW